MSRQTTWIVSIRGHKMISRLTRNLSSVAAHILVLGWSHSVLICLNSMLMLMLLMVLTHWGRVMHKCVSELTIVGSDNGLSPGRCQAINWTIVRILSIGKLGTNFSEILLEIDTFFIKNAFEYVVWKWQPFYLGFNVLTLSIAVCNYVSIYLYEIIMVDDGGGIPCAAFS